MWYYFAHFFNLQFFRMRIFYKTLAVLGEKAAAAAAAAKKKENIYLNLHKNFRKCLNQIENQTQKVPKH